MKNLIIILTLLFLIIGCHKDNTSNQTDQVRSNWIVQKNGTTNALNTLNSVYFTDANTGYTVGYSGTILKTINGGATWTEQTSGTTQILTSVFFTDANTGYIAGWDGTILKTVNAGENWISQTSGVTYALYSVFFTDSNTGYVTFSDMEGGILKTINAGTTWSMQNCSSSAGLNSISFAGNTGCAVGFQIITKSSNSDWTVQKAYSTTNSNLNSVYFTDANNGCAVGSDGEILKTSNGGATWITINSGTTSTLYSVYFTNSNTGYAVGGAVTMVDSGLNYLAKPYKGTILKTTDGGATWTSQPSGTIYPLYSVFFTDANTGYAVGEDGVILKTITGGE
jgi:photosystem II stability/assembly factor-like uncharacterized protein